MLLSNDTLRGPIRFLQGTPLPFPLSLTRFLRPDRVKCQMRQVQHPAAKGLVQARIRINREYHQPKQNTNQRGVFLDLQGERLRIYPLDFSHNHISKRL